MRSTKVDADVLRVLERSVLSGTDLSLPPKLDRKLYLKVAEVLEAIGCTWSKKRKVHVFEEPAEDRIGDVLATGSVTRPQDLGFFPTPEPVVRAMMIEAGIKSGMTVLEPSAGTGSLALAAAKVVGEGKVVCVEIDEGRAKKLKMAGFTRVETGDFLTLSASKPAWAKAIGSYDVALMNPPFDRRRAEISHVVEAFGYLKPGGRLVSVMPSGIRDRQDSRSIAFRDMMDGVDGYMLDIPDGSFKSAGTGIGTVLVGMNKP